MSSYETYKEYVALKSHFNKHDYDYIKYGGKICGNLARKNKRIMNEINNKTKGKPNIASPIHLGIRAKQNTIRGPIT